MALRTQASPAEGVLTESDPTHWKYLSEGGASIVFTYTGPPNPLLDGRVLRVRKSPVPSTTEQTKDSATNKLISEEDEDPAIAFQHAVIEKVVSPDLLPRFQSVSVSSEWLLRLSELVEPLRPTGRRSRDCINVHRRTAVLASDLVGHEGVAIEIKVRLLLPFILLPKSDYRASDYLYRTLLPFV